jgi:WD40 repeat protein
MRRLFIGAWVGLLVGQAPWAVGRPAAPSLGEAGREAPRSFAGGKPVWSVALSPDGKVLAASGPEQVHVWDVHTGKLLCRLGLRDVRCLAFSPDGKALAAAARDAPGTVFLWDVPTWRPRPSIKFAGTQAERLFFLDGKTVAATVVGPVPSFRAWEVGTGREVRKVVLGAHDWQRTAVSPDGKFLAVAQDASFGNRSIRLVDVRTGEVLRTMAGHAGQAHVLAFSPDGRVLASADVSFTPTSPRPPRGFRRERYRPPVEGDGLIRFWDTATGQEIQRSDRPVEAACCLAFSPDGRMLAVRHRGASPRGGREDVLSFWEPASGKERLRFAVEGPESGGEAIAFSADGKSVAWGLERARAWRLAGPARAGHLAPRELASLWDDLSGPDAARAFRAVEALGGGGAQAVQVIRGLPASIAAFDRDTAGLIAKLNSDVFAEREQATAGLEKLGEQARPAVLRALRAPASLEARRRLEGARAKLAAGPTHEGQRMRALRAVEVLERLGTREAREVLRALAAGKGPLGEVVARQARASLARLAVPRP